MYKKQIQMYNHDDSIMPKCNINDEVVFIDASGRNKKKKLTDIVNNITTNNHTMISSRKRRGTSSNQTAATAITNTSRRRRTSNIGFKTINNNVGNLSKNNINLLLNQIDCKNSSLYSKYGSSVSSNSDMIQLPQQHQTQQQHLDNNDYIICKRSININVIYKIKKSLTSNNHFDIMNRLQNEEMHSIGRLLTRQQQPPNCDNFYNLRGRIIFKKKSEDNSTTLNNNITAAISNKKKCIVNDKNKFKKVSKNLPRSIKKNKEKIILNNTFPACGRNVNQIISSFNLIYEATTSLDKTTNEKISQVSQFVAGTDDVQQQYKNQQQPLSLPPPALHLISNTPPPLTTTKISSINPDTTTNTITLLQFNNIPITRKRKLNNLLSIDSSKKNSVDNNNYPGDNNENMEINTEYINYIPTSSSPLATKTTITPKSTITTAVAALAETTTTTTTQTNNNTIISLKNNYENVSESSNSSSNSNNSRSTSTNINLVMETTEHAAIPSNLSPIHMELTSDISPSSSSSSLVPTTTISDVIISSSTPITTRRMAASNLMTKTNSAIKHSVESLISRNNYSIIPKKRLYSHEFGKYIYTIVFFFIQCNIIFFFVITVTNSCESRQQLQQLPQHHPDIHPSLNTNINHDDDNSISSISSNSSKILMDLDVGEAPLCKIRPHNNIQLQQQLFNSTPNNIDIRKNNSKNNNYQQQQHQEWLALGRNLSKIDVDEELPIIKVRAPIPAGSSRMNFFKKIASGTKVIWPLHDKKTFIFIERDLDVALKLTRLIYPHVESNMVETILNKLIVVPSEDRVEIKKICCICYHKPIKGHIVQHSNNHWKSKIKITVDTGCWSLFDLKRSLYQLNNKPVYTSTYLRQYEGIMKIWTDHFASNTETNKVFEDLVRLVNISLD